MSAHHTTLARRRRRVTALGLAALVTAATWSVLTAAVAAGQLTLPDWRGAAPLLLAVPVLAAVGGLATRARLARPIELAAWWVILSGAALLAATRVEDAALLIVGLPVLVLSAVACARHPAPAIIGAFAVSGAFGSLQAFLQFPTTSTVNLVLGSLWLGIPAGYLLGRRSRSVQPWLPLAGLGLFVAITLAQLVTSSGETDALDSFLGGTWFMAVIVVLAFAPWSPETYARIGRGIVAVAFAVGAYATLRWIIGPAAEEEAIARFVSYNYSGDELKLLGSFPNGSDLGQWTAAMIPFCAAAAVWLPGAWRVVSLLTVGLLAIAMLGSQLRIGLPAAALGTALVVLLWLLSRSLPGLRLGTASAVAVLAVTAGSAAFIVTGGSTDPNRSYSNIFEPGQDPSFQARTYKWEQALRDLDDKPLGYGLGSATSGVAGTIQASSRFRTNVGQQSVDSGYLKVALEQGFTTMVIFGGALLLLLVGLARRAAVETDRQRAGLLIGAAGTLAAFAVLLVTGAFQESLAATGAWLVIGIGAAQAVVRPAS